MHLVKASSLFSCLSLGTFLAVNTTDSDLEEYLAIQEVKAACLGTKVFANTLVAILFRPMCPTSGYDSSEIGGKVSGTSKLIPGWVTLLTYCLIRVLSPYFVPIPY
jgi:hypothetical protein